MNKKLLTVLMAGSLIATVNTSAFAKGTGRVEFSDHIVTDTYIIDVGDARANTVVTFTDAYPGNFDGDGIPGPTKDSRISLAKCGPAITSLNLRFSGDTTDGENLRLENDLSDANAVTDVGIAVTNSSGGNTDVVFDGSAPVSTTDVVDAGDEATPSILNYTAEMIQVGDEKPTVGKYHAFVNFAVLYR